jgi:hypothetical protein
VELRKTRNVFLVPPPSSSPWTHKEMLNGTRMGTRGKRAWGRHNLVARRLKAGFPMIGKNFRDVFGKGDNNSREVQGLSDNSDNSRQLFSTLKSMKTASRTRNAWRADGVRQLDNSGGKRMGKRVEAGGAGVPPATIPESENRPKTACFPLSPIQRRGWKPHLRKSRDACPEGPAPLPEVRHPAAPNQGENARPQGRTASCHLALVTAVQLCCRTKSAIEKPAVAR